MRCNWRSADGAALIASVLKRFKVITFIYAGLTLLSATIIWVHFYPHTVLAVKILNIGLSLVLPATLMYVAWCKNRIHARIALIAGCTVSLLSVVCSLYMLVCVLILSIVHHAALGMRYIYAQIPGITGFAVTIIAVLLILAVVLLNCKGRGIGITMIILPCLGYALVLTGYAAVWIITVNQPDVMFDLSAAFPQILQAGTAILSTILFSLLNLMIGVRLISHARDTQVSNNQIETES